MSKKNQHSEVLNHLQTKGNITSIEAIELYGATRLSAIIFNLRKKGYDIETKMLTGYTRYGDTCNYAKYIYHGKEENNE